MRTDLNVSTNAVSINSALVLVRTPFQAWLVERVLEAEKVATYDLLYFTQNDSTEDRFYYGRLAENARAARFVFVERQARDLLNHFRLALRAWPFLRGKQYDMTMLASIDSYVLNAIASRNAAGELVTFDDGTANFNREGVYFREAPSRKARLYRQGFRASSINSIKARITRHYTIHADLENIVGGDRLFSITGWRYTKLEADSNQRPKVFFIGAPFKETLDPEQIKLLETHALQIGINVYVRHPREREPLSLGVPLLNKHGRIAEEAILDNAAGRPIVLVGFLSSVMFNLAFCADRRIVLVPRGSERHAYLIELARQSGCEIVLFERPGDVDGR